MQIMYNEVAIYRKNVRKAWDRLALALADLGLFMSTPGPPLGSDAPVYVNGSVNPGPDRMFCEVAGVSPKSVRLCVHSPADLDRTIALAEELEDRGFGVVLEIGFYVDELEEAERTKVTATLYAVIDRGGELGLNMAGTFPGKV